MEHIILGKLGEDLAVKFLQNHNYKIIGRNLRVGHKEIDILAYKNKAFHFIEVKSQHINSMDAIYRLSKKKITLLKKAVDEFSLILAIKSPIYISAIIVKIDYSNKMANIRYISTII